MFVLFFCFYGGSHVLLCIVTNESIGMQCGMETVVLFSSLTSEPMLTPILLSISLYGVI